MLFQNQTIAQIIRGWKPFPQTFYVLNYKKTGGIPL